MRENSVFAHNLKVLRERRGLSFRGLAKATGISKSMLQKYETMTKDPGLSKVQKLIKFFDVDPQVLTGDIYLEGDSEGKERKKRTT